MYLSKITLHPTADIQAYMQDILPQQESDWFSHPKNEQFVYNTHQFMWKLFPNDGTKKRDFLYREMKAARLPYFYLLSEEIPTETKYAKVQSKLFQPAFKKDQLLEFDLLANPVVTSNKKKHDVWMHAKYPFPKDKRSSQEAIKAAQQASLNWLVKQGQNKGFKLLEDDNSSFGLSAYIDGNHQYTFQKAKKDKRTTSLIKVSGIHYKGILQVTDPTLFAAKLKEGFGASRSFGFGMMLVKPIRS